MHAPAPVGSEYAVQAAVAPHVLPAFDGLQIVAHAPLKQKLPARQLSSPSELKAHADLSATEPFGAQPMWNAGGLSLSLIHVHFSDPEQPVCANTSHCAGGASGASIAASIAASMPASDPLPPPSPPMSLGCGNPHPTHIRNTTTLRTGSLDCTDCRSGTTQLTGAPASPTTGQMVEGTQVGAYRLLQRIG